MKHLRYFAMGLLMVAAIVTCPIWGPLAAIYAMGRGLLEPDPGDPL